MSLEDRDVKMDILIVEDDVAISRLMEIYLKKEGFAVIYGQVAKHFEQTLDLGGSVSFSDGIRIAKGHFGDRFRIAGRYFGLPLAPAQIVAGDIDRQGVKPGVKLPSRTKCVEPIVGFEEGVLGQISGLLPRACGPVHQIEYGVFVLADDTTKGLYIPQEDRFHQTIIFRCHHGLICLSTPHIYHLVK